MRMYEQHLGALRGEKGPGFESALLRRPEPEARDDGASILAALGRDDGVVDELLAAFQTETDMTARDSLILAAGRLKSRKAVPILAGIIRDETADGDTRWTAAESLGLIVRQRFNKREDPIRAAIEWLDRHGGKPA